MFLESRIDSLIEAGWNVLYTDFDETAFRLWKQRAHECLAVLLGPEHPYTEHFRALPNQKENLSVLAGAGLLEATKQELSNIHGAALLMRNQEREH